MKAASLCLLISALAASAFAQGQSPLAPPVTTPAAKPGVVVLKVGDKAPEFALPNGDGKLVLLTDYVAKGPVVVVFYRGYW